MKISICIPLHNAEQWVASAVESALAQREEGIEIEVIVMDDHSTDGSVERLQPYSHAITFLQSEGRGATAARNQALYRASGEWVQFLDADDYLKPGKIAAQLKEAGEAIDQAHVLYAPVLVEQWKNEEVVSTEPTRIREDFDIYERWIAWQLPQTGGALWRRQALLDLGGWKQDQPCCQEHELYARALRAGLTFRMTSRPGAVYRIWSEETLCRRDPVQVVHVKTALIDEMCAWMTAQGLWQEKHRRLAGQVCFEMARTMAKHSVGAAAEYKKKRKESGLWELAGPAAPKSYRLANRLLGFRLAERLARLMRHS